MEQRLTSRRKEFVLNLTVVLVSCAIGYLLIEVIFFRFVLTNWPPALRTYLPETADVIVQNSKSGPIPHNYIAILGDSYAEGVGDWMLENGENRALPFHSANIIHDRLQRDVVSFGREDIGSAEALVRMPTHILEGSKCFIFPNIDDPAGLVIYFYEGNDIRDNLLFLTNVNAAYGATEQPQIDRYLSEVYANFAPWRCQLHLSDTIGRMAKLYYRTLVYGSGFTAKVRVNSVLLSGGTTEAPYLEGAAIDMTDEQIVAGVRVFDRSLAWLQHRFPGVPVTVIYIPGAVSIYRFTGDTVSFFSRKVIGWTAGKAPISKVERNNRLMCRLVRQASTDHGARFVDAKPTLRAAASTQAIHGPRDWDHLNRAGYTVLGNLVADHLKTGAADTGCAP
jgi:hypothetical protein